MALPNVEVLGLAEAGYALEDFATAECNLWRANLSGANLHNAFLYDAGLQGANLSGANLRGANLRRIFLWSAKKGGGLRERRPAHGRPERCRPDGDRTSRGLVQCRYKVARRLRPGSGGGGVGGR